MVVGSAGALGPPCQPYRVGAWRARQRRGMRQERVIQGPCGQPQARVSSAEGLESHDTSWWLGNGEHALGSKGESEGGWVYWCRGARLPAGLTSLRRVQSMGRTACHDERLVCLDLHVQFRKRVNWVKNMLIGLISGVLVDGEVKRCRTGQHCCRRCCLRCCLHQWVVPAALPSQQPSSFARPQHPCSDGQRRLPAHFQPGPHRCRGCPGCLLAPGSPVPPAGRCHPAAG